MSYAKTLIRVGQRYQLARNDVESIYGELVRVVGGTRFVNGGTITAGGTLDFRNFHPNAGITNMHKANARGLYSIAIAIASYTAPGALSTHIPLPLGNLGVTPAFEGIVNAMTLSYSSMANATNTGTAQLFYKRIGTDTQIGTTVNWTNAATTPTVLSNQVLGTPVQLTFGDIIKLTFTNNVNTTGVIAHLWCTASHVKL